MHRGEGAVSAEAPHRSRFGTASATMVDATRLMLCLRDAARSSVVPARRCMRPAIRSWKG